MKKNKNDLIVDEFKKNQPLLRSLEEVVVAELQKGLKRSGIRLQGIEHRIKREASLREKLGRKRDKYDDLFDVTDTLGIRVICYFADDVDRIASVCQKIFDVDKEASVDERKEISINKFGYLSLHYICKLKNNGKYPEELTKIPFEVQMRSSLQHIWAEIEHDMGYKNDFGVPKNIQREFAQVAGLLEVADKCFDEIRVKMTRYENSVRKDISHDKAHDLPLDHVSLKEFITHSKQFQKFLALLQGDEKTKITQISPDAYLENFELLGVHTIGDLLKLMDQEQDHAVELFQDMKKEQEFGDFAASMGLFLLCQARLVWGNRNEKQIMKYYVKTSRNEAQAERRTKKILQIRQDKGLTNK